MTRQEDAFFIVWNPQGGNPRVRHDTFEKAADEAKRLALSAPGNEFFVMQAHRRVTTPVPLIVEDFNTDLYIPF